MRTIIPLPLFPPSPAASVRLRPLLEGERGRDRRNGLSTALAQGMSVVAEGVETTEQQAFLATRRRGQGCLFSRPRAA